MSSNIKIKYNRDKDELIKNINFEDNLLCNQNLLSKNNIILNISKNNELLNTRKEQFLKINNNYVKKFITKTSVNKDCSDNKKTFKNLSNNDFLSPLTNLNKKSISIINFKNKNNFSNSNNISKNIISKSLLLPDNNNKNNNNNISKDILVFDNKFNKDVKPYISSNDSTPSKRNYSCLYNKGVNNLSKNNIEHKKIISNKDKNLIDNNNSKTVIIKNSITDCYGNKIFISEIESKSKNIISKLKPIDIRKYARVTDNKCVNSFFNLSTNKENTNYLYKKIIVHSNKKSLPKLFNRNLKKSILDNNNTVLKNKSTANNSLIKNAKSSKPTNIIKFFNSKNNSKIKKINVNKIDKSNNVSNYISKIY